MVVHTVRHGSFFTFNLLYKKQYDLTIHVLQILIFFTKIGTFIGNIRLEGHKPMQMPVDSKFRFGASTRTYILRERPQTGNRPIMVRNNNLRITAI